MEDNPINAQQLESDDRFPVDGDLVLVHGNWFEIKALPMLLGNYMNLVTRHQRDLKDTDLKRQELADKVSSWEWRYEKLRQETGRVMQDSNCTTADLRLLERLDNDAKSTTLKVLEQLLDSLNARLREFNNPCPEQFQIKMEVEMLGYLYTILVARKSLDTINIPNEEESSK